MTEEVQFPAGAHEIFLFKASRRAMGPTIPPSQWVSRAVKWPGCEADHSHLYSVDNKTIWSYISTRIFLHVMVLNKAQGPLSVFYSSVLYVNNHSCSCSADIPGQVSLHRKTDHHVIYFL
jgi:hypothetical protein